MNDINEMIYLFEKIEFPELPDYYKKKFDNKINKINKIKGRLTRVEIGVDRLYSDLYIKYKEEDKDYFGEYHTSFKDWLKDRRDKEDINPISEDFNFGEEECEECDLLD